MSVSVGFPARVGYGLEAESLWTEPQVQDFHISLTTCYKKHRFVEKYVSYIKVATPKTKNLENDFEN